MIAFHTCVVLKIPYQSPESGSSPCSLESFLCSPDAQRRQEGAARRHQNSCSTFSRACSLLSLQLGFCLASSVSLWMLVAQCGEMINCRCGFRLSASRAPGSHLSTSLSSSVSACLSGNQLTQRCFSVDLGPCLTQAVAELKILAGFVVKLIYMNYHYYRYNNSWR